MTVGVLAPERLARVLGTAAREFATKGYEGASLNQIIRECAMSKSSFYHYFNSKAALFDTVVREAMQGLALGLAAPAPEALRGPQFWGDLEELVARILEVAARGDWCADAGRLFYLLDAPVRESPAVHESTAAMTRWLDEALAVGRSCGEIREDLPAALQATLVLDVVQRLDRWALEHARERGDERDDLAALLIDVVRRMLAPAPPSSC